MRNILIAILCILYLILGWLFYKDHKVCCSDKTEEISQVLIGSHKSGPLLFSFNSITPIIGEGWTALRDSVAHFATDSTMLTIVGWYCTNTSPQEDESIAKQRAQEVQKLFPEVDNDYIMLSSKPVTCKDGRPEINEEAITFGVTKIESNVKHVDDKTMIYFPYNSTKEIDDQEVRSYLDDVAERVIKSGEKISLTGHTDNTGSAEYNMKLGQQRADVIKAYLVSKGVAASQVTAISKGQNDPIADNNTDSGRAKNRRTELYIN